MSEKKKWTMEEINNIDMQVGWQRGTVFDAKGKKIIAVEIRKESSDGMGDYLIRLFKPVNDHFEEIDLRTASRKMASQLAKNIKAEFIIREVLIEEGGGRFLDLMERLKKKPKVTASVKRGSCVYLNVRGKKGPAMSVQLTE